VARAHKNHKHQQMFHCLMIIDYQLTNKGQRRNVFGFAVGNLC
jgi:hypothetical protein